MIMPAAQKPHWNACASMKARCIGCSSAVARPDPGCVVISRPAARNAGIRQEWIGRAVEPDRAGAAVAGIAAFLDAEHAAVAQKGSQALAGSRFGREDFRIDGVIHGGQSYRGKLCANLFGEVIGQVMLVVSRPVHVVEIAVRTEWLVDGPVQRFAPSALRRKAQSAPAGAWPR